MSEERLKFNLGFDIKTVANGFIVVPWGEPDSHHYDDVYVFNTNEQLLKFISHHALNFSMPDVLRITKEDS